MVTGTREVVDVKILVIVILHSIYKSTTFCWRFLGICVLMV